MNKSFLNFISTWHRLSYLQSEIFNEYSATEFCLRWTAQLESKRGPQVLFYKSLCVKPNLNVAQNCVMQSDETLENLVGCIDWWLVVVLNWYFFYNIALNHVDFSIFSTIILSLRSKKRMNKPFSLEKCIQLNDT